MRHIFALRIIGKPYTNTRYTPYTTSARMSPQTNVEKSCMKQLYKSYKQMLRWSQAFRLSVWWNFTNSMDVGFQFSLWDKSPYPRATLNPSNTKYLSSLVTITPKKQLDPFGCLATMHRHIETDKHTTRRISRTVTRDQLESSEDFR